MSQQVLIGGGNFVYKVIEKWELLPEGFHWKETVGVATDDQDNVYVFNRGDHPMIVLDMNGNFIKSWGENIFTRPHGVSQGPDNTLYCTDEGDHTVRQCTIDGKVLLTLGRPGIASSPFSGVPFSRCTHTATDPNTGDIYVSDGYANARVHKFSPDGKLLFSWGSPGVGESEFNIVHNIATDKDGYVYVCDRENHRIQIFNRDGTFETMWSNVHRPCAIQIDEDQNIYVGELGWATSVNKDMPNIGPRVSVLNRNGRVLQRIGTAGYGLNPGQFIAPHGIGLDSKRNIYVAEVAHTNISHHSKPPNNLRSFQKLQKT